MILPAMLVFYWVAIKLPWKKKVLWLLAAMASLGIFTVAYPASVDSVSTSSRPYIGSSQTNSLMELAFGYNGTQRLLGQTSGTGGTFAGMGKSSKKSGGNSGPGGTKPTGTKSTTKNTTTGTTGTNTGNTPPGGTAGTKGTAPTGQAPTGSKTGAPTGTKPSGSKNGAPTGTKPSGKMGNPGKGGMAGGPSVRSVASGTAFQTNNQTFCSGPAGSFQSTDSSPWLLYSTLITPSC
ncbi:PMT family glycosyltransferase ArnT/Agl22 [Fructobacillus fructosus]|uniref:Involved in glycosylation of proteins and lipid IVA (ArnT) n=1 Tax=Fructobacillus fructosus TaxID=1631 RepID=A0ABM9MYH5_9LACO|nr:PMT family glycosyltransferase ArnT/Agl22 [Fructobacillus fructosus]